MSDKQGARRACGGGVTAILLMALTAPGMMVGLPACGAADSSEASPPLDSERPPTTWAAVPVGSEPDSEDAGVVGEAAATAYRPPWPGPITEAIGDER